MFATFSSFFDTGEKGSEASVTSTEGSEAMMRCEDFPTPNKAL